MEESKKVRSRDAARCRRGQQNDELSELTNYLPVVPQLRGQLDRLHVMRLCITYIKMKHILSNCNGPGNEVAKHDQLADSVNPELLNLLDGFVFVISTDGQCLYISPNVADYLGLLPLEVIGSSIYKYVHPCDQEELADALGGNIPLEDMEIFDGLFCREGEYGERPSKRRKIATDDSQHFSIFLRMKSTRTSRGKSVNLNASIYRVVHCFGVSKSVCIRTTPNSPGTRCFIAVGTPLLCASTMEVPLDTSVLVTRHSLDMKLIESSESCTEFMGYPLPEMLKQSWYTFTHACDEAVIVDCHKTLIQKGQAVSGYYRLLSKQGGWSWVQTKASVVYVGSTGQPDHIMCLHYIIGGPEKTGLVLSIIQNAPAAVDNIVAPAQVGLTSTVSDRASPELLPKVELPVPLLEDPDSTQALYGLEDDVLDDELCFRAPYIPPPTRDELSLYVALDDFKKLGPLPKDERADGQFKASPGVLDRAHLLTPCLGFPTSPLGVNDWPDLSPWLDENSQPWTNPNEHESDVCSSLCGWVNTAASVQYSHLAGVSPLLSTTGSALHRSCAPEDPFTEDISKRTPIPIHLTDEVQSSKPLHLNSPRTLPGTGRMTTVNRIIRPHVL